MDLDTVMADMAMVEPSADEYVSEEAASKRINPAITPDDAAWKTQYKHFRTLLNSPNKTIQQIMLENFTQHEARMFTPSDRHDLQSLQQKNAVRYNALLSTRFKAAEKNLATKMTMMYFGLPVEPMVMPLDELVREMETREPEGQRWDVDPPLHFLTAHNHRNWGKDALKGSEAPNWPLPIPTQREVELHLRGGAAPADQDETPLALRGGAAPADIGGAAKQAKGKNVVRNKPTATSSLIKPQYLYGYQGCISFTHSDHKSYATAVRHLLSLSPGMNVKGMHYSLVHFDRKTKKVVSVTHDKLPVSKDSASYHYLQLHFNHLKHVDCCAFFVKLKHEPEPAHWEPSTEQFKLDLVKIRLGDHPLKPVVHNADNLPSTAYLAFPKTKKPSFDISDFAANQYNDHLRVATEVLIGRSDDSCNPSMVSLQGNSLKTAAWDRIHSVYGALGETQEMWNLLHPLNSPGVDWTLYQKKLEPGQLMLVLPNYYPRSMDQNLLLTLDPEMDGENHKYEELVKSIMKGAFGSEAEDKLDHVLLFPGSAVLDRDSSNHQNVEGYYIPIRPEDPNPQSASLSEVLHQFIINKQEPFAFLHPVWKIEGNTLFAGWQQEGTTERVKTVLPSLGLSKHFIAEAVEYLCTTEGRGKEFRPKEHFLTITPVNQPDGLPMTDCPTYVVGSETTEDEWFRIRLSITARQLAINIVPKKGIDWRSKIPKSNVWGPRYGLAAAPTPSVSAKETSMASVSFDPATTADADGKGKKTLPKTPVTQEFKKSRDQNARVGQATDPKPNTTAQPQVAPTTQGIPKKSGPPVDRNDRERTWATQPSLFDFAEPRIPINAPPAEYIHRTTSSLPMVSKAVLTPTEQARLQKDFWELRNIILARLARCQYKDCDFTYRLDDRATIEKHIEYEHLAQKCMWCDEPLYQWWNKEQKMKHLKQKHENQLKAALSVGQRNLGQGSTQTSGTQGRETARSSDIPPVWARRGDNRNQGFGFQAQQKPVPVKQLDPDVIRKARQAYDPSEENHYFCDRCGLNYAMLASVYEAEHHQRHCVRRPMGLDTFCTFCTSCGERVNGSSAAGGDHGHSCGQSSRYCNKCGIDQSPFSPAQHRHHAKTCKGFGSYPYLKCPWCGCDLELSYKNNDAGARNMQHMHACEREKKNLPPSPITKRDPYQSHHDERAAETPEYASHQDEAAEFERKECPFFERCGALVGEMSEEQMINHLRDSHNSTLGIPPDEDEDEEDDGDDDSDDDDADAPPEAKIRGKGPAKGKAPRRASPRKRARPSPQPKEPETELETVEEVSSSSETPNVAPSPARGRTRTPRKTIEVAKMVDSDEDIYSDDREQDPNEARRRAPSPDWVEKLGPGDDDFEPDENMYCSKCLRKAPKMRDRSPGRSPLGRNKEMEYHTDPERCCRIRNGIGSAERLPNRSGWIPKADLPKRVGLIKEKFLKKYPGYEQTLYPINKSDTNASLWRSDPNNETNSAFWSIPWPPYSGPPPFPSDWEHPTIPSQPNRPKRKIPKAKAVHDPAYKYHSDEDSADGLQPDVNDLGEKKKRRRAEDPTFKPSGVEETEDRAVKKVRLSPEEGGRKKRDGKGKGKDGAK